MKSIYRGFAAFAVLIAISGTADAAVELFNQGFESDTAGWFDFGGTIAQVSSSGGALGVSSANGSGHAEVAIGSGTGDGAYTAFGAYRYTWPGEFIRQSLDIYIDPAAGDVGDGWFLDNAVSDNLNNSIGISGSSDWREGGGVGALKATDGNWWVAADADGGAYQGPASGGVGLKIDTAGWYTILSEWVANGDGLTVDRNTYIYNSSGVELYSNLNSQQVPLTGAFPIGGNRYGWLAANSPTSMTLAIDNSVLTVNDPAVPEPTALLVWVGLGFCLSAQRRRFAWKSAEA